MNKKEKDHRFKSVLTIGSNKFEVICDLTLPKSVYKNPIVLIHLNQEQLHIAAYSNSDMALYGTNGQQEIVIEKAYFESGNQQSWGKEISEVQMVIVPKKLEIIEKVSDVGVNQVTFILTDSIYLQPSEFFTLSYDGTITHYAESKYKSFNLDADKTVVFKNQHKWENDDHKTIRSTELTGEIKLCKSTQPVDQVSECISLMEDYLLLISFCENRRIMFNRYVVQNTKEIKKVFLLNKVLPKHKKDHFINSFLLYPDEIDKKINIVWTGFRNSKYTSDLRNAIYGHMSDFDDLGETIFLRYFSTIETLCSVYRKENQMELIFEASLWRKLKSTLKKSVKKMYADKSYKLQRSEIYKNIEGVNRVSLSCVLNSINSEKEVVVEDLWPLLTESRVCSLTEIRNKLTHGVGLSKQQHEHFFVSLRSIKILARRYLLVFLGCNSLDGKCYKRSPEFAEKWKASMNELSDWQ